MSKARLETFTDGVFAIAITLLVLTITEPSDYRHLTRQLADRWPSLAAYAVSFLVIGIMWLNHHSIFSAIARIDRPLFYLNLILLMTVVFIPYPTGIFGEALRRGQGERMAAVVYSATMAVNAYAWGALWLYASTGRRLLDDSFPESHRRPATYLFLVGTALYTATIVVALVNAYACLAVHALLAVYYALDPLARRASRAPS
ncbi:MAG: TMEM175 family protein [Acidimicrobiales bacterium]